MGGGSLSQLLYILAAAGAESAPGAPAKDDGHDHSAQLHAWLRDANLEIADLRQKLADAEPHRVRRFPPCITHILASLCWLC